MKRLAIVTQKGGSGKTTLAIHLAVAAMQSGERVTIIDLDPQQSAMGWSRIRGELDNAIRITRAIAPDLPQQLAEAERMGFTLAIADTPPHMDRSIYEVVKSMDFILIPVRPSILDLSALKSTIALLLTTQIGQPGTGIRGPYAFTLNGVAQRTTEGRETADILAEFGKVLKTQIGERVDFRRALAEGKGVTEYAPLSKAAQEAQDLWKEIRRLLK